VIEFTFILPTLPHACILVPHHGHATCADQLKALDSGAGSVATNVVAEGGISISIADLLRNACKVEEVQRQMWEEEGAQEGGASAADMLLSIASHPRRYPAVYPGIAAEHTLSAETKAFLRRAESVLKVIKPEEPLTWVRMHFSQPKATSILACF
jgi:hypothetical protein